MAEFTYNNTKNASTKYTPFKRNYEYHLCVSYKQDVDLRFRLKVADELTKELRNLMTTHRKNLQHT